MPSDGSRRAISQPDSWWTPARKERWEELDSAARTAVAQYREKTERRIRGGYVCGASAPNPNGINADITPDGWHFSSPAENVPDPQLLATLLNRELGEPIMIRERTSEWEDGYWFVVESGNAE